MKEIKKANVNALIKDALKDIDSWSEIEVPYAADKNVKIKLRDALSITDIKQIADLIATAACGEGIYNYAIERLAMARFYLEFCTNVPLPMLEQVEEDKKEESVDYNMCYFLVFGEDKIVDNMDLQSLPYALYMRIEEFTRRAIEAEKERNLSVNYLAERLIQLLDAIPAALQDFQDNPATVLELAKELNKTVDHPTKED